MSLGIPVAKKGLAVDDRHILSRQKECFIHFFVFPEVLLPAIQSMLLAPYEEKTMV